MSKRPAKTLADIAQLAGVSKSTVSRALNDSALIGAETKARIRALAKKNNFQLNSSARNLSLRQSNTIAFVTHAHHKESSVADLFTLEILSGISNTLRGNRYDLLIASVDPYDAEWPHHYLDTGRVDGFILMTTTRKQLHMNALAEMGAPFIIWGIPAQKSNCCSVTGDNFNGGKLATEHLLKLGKKRIAFLGGPEEELEVQRRYEGYEAALKDAGLTPEVARVAYGYFSKASGEKAMRRLLEQAPDLDAVFVNSDLMAIAAMTIIHAQGRRIPEDIAVVGYDNLSIAENCNPPLTTISQNIPLAGKLLAQNLLQYLQTGVVTNVVVPVELVIRQSA